jgi:hypothetical protein
VSNDHDSLEQFEAVHDADDFEEQQSCWNCMGAGGFHDCFDDTCVCADPDELTETCEECEGSGEL